MQSTKKIAEFYLPLFTTTEFNRLSKTAHQLGYRVIGTIDGRRMYIYGLDQSNPKEIEALFELAGVKI